MARRISSIIIITTTSVIDQNATSNSYTNRGLTQHYRIAPNLHYNSEYPPSTPLLQQVTYEYRMEWLQ